MKYIFLQLVILWNMLLWFDSASGQSLPVGTVAFEDHYRRSQLLGQIDSTISFTVRPLSQPLLAGSSIDTSNNRYSFGNLNSIFHVPKESKFKIGLLPLNWQSQINTHLPYGWNDGPMIPAKGFQMVVSGGLYAKYGPLSVQLKPEIITAENYQFTALPLEHYEVIWARYYDYYNYIDLPTRFGNKQYTKAYWGQSNIRLNFDPVSIGISTENLWWGPGMRNSLLMSNTAPGFKHFTINTTRPITTKVGSFEGQLIAGGLESSGFGPLTPDRFYFGAPLYLPKPADWRYISGITVNWQPKWVRGLFLGFARSSQLYSKDLGGKLTNYLPVFSPFKKINTDEPVNNKREQLSSLFMRWLWPEENAEIYFEYGRNNHSLSLRDLSLEPESSRAYLFGIRKLFPFNKQKEEYFMVNAEVTQLQQTSVSTVRKAGAWYVSKYIRHGYTHQGQTIGAGIGPGGNLQSIDISWFKGIKRIGLQIERYVHNNDFYYYAYEDSQDFRRHWVDLSIGASAEWDYKNFVFNAKLQGIKSLNYYWYIFQNSSPNYMEEKGLDRFNMQMQLGATYRF